MNANLTTLTVNKGDIIKVTFTKNCKIDEALQIFDNVKKQFPDNRVIAYFDRDCSIEVTHNDENDKNESGL